MYRCGSVRIYIRQVQKRIFCAYHAYQIIRKLGELLMFMWRVLQM